MLRSLANGVLLLPSIEFTASLARKCRSVRNQADTWCINVLLSRNGLGTHRSLGNYLVVMLVEIQCIHEADRVYQSLVFRNEHAWNFLITGLVEFGSMQRAFELYQEMQGCGTIHISGHTYVSLLKACVELKDMETGIALHNAAANSGLLEKNIFIGCTLVDMYAKCGSLERAEQVFNELSDRNVVLWTTLIAGYVRHGDCARALECFATMRAKGVLPNSVTYVSALKACSVNSDMNQGLTLHLEILKRGMQDGDHNVDSSLIAMYSTVGELSTAQYILEMNPNTTEGTWNALITACADCGYDKEALDVYDNMLLKGICPDAITILSILKVCGNMRTISVAQQVHIDIEKRALMKQGASLSNALVDVYSNFGWLGAAEYILHSNPKRDVVSWSALISGCAEHEEHAAVALGSFEKMQAEFVQPNSITFVCAIKACVSLLDVEKGQQIHSEVERFQHNLDRANPLIGNSLIDMYLKFGFVNIAEEVFNSLVIRDVITWNSIISGYVEHGYVNEAIKAFEQMHVENIMPDCITITCILKGCSMISQVDIGKEMHTKIQKLGLFDREPSIGNSLLDMYVKNGCLVDAQQVFDSLPCRDVVAWTTLIIGYAEHGFGENAYKCYRGMQDNGCCPDVATIMCVLKACASIESIYMGKTIHSDIEKRGLLKEYPIVGNTLLDMYVKCGLFAVAEQIFNKLIVRDVVPWTTLIAGFVEHGCSNEALMSFDRMQRVGIPANAATFICILKACGSLIAVAKGQEIHSEIEKHGLLVKNLDVANTLIDMYAKCGLVSEAHHVFHKLSIKDVVSWNALLAAYAQSKECPEMFSVFENMIEQGTKPNEISFLIILSACSSMGLFEKGHCFLEEMIQEYGITPTLEHHTCIVDLLSRAGYLDKAISLVKDMPFSLDHALLNSLLCASKNWGSVGVGKQVFTSLQIV